jgi:hypothetical protein
MAGKRNKRILNQEVSFWRAYLEILSERVPLVDRWRDGSQTWHPRVVQKLLWYSGMASTFKNRVMAHHWLMQNANKAARHTLHTKTKGVASETGGI